jgi:uncharacterized protein DUF4252
MRLRILFLSLTIISAPLLAQKGRLDLRFDHLVDKAEQTVDVNLEGPMLRLATSFLSSRDPDQRKVKEAVSGLTGIYVRSFEFDDRGAYSAADLEKVRSQLDSSWQRIVTVRSKRKENVEILVRGGETMARGIVIIAAEPTEFTVVQLVGDIDLEKLADLNGEFGIPNIDVEVRRSEGDRP